MRHSILALPFLLLVLLVPPAHGADGVPDAGTRTVALVLYDGVELLDFAGPGEVFEAANAFVPTDGDPAFRVITVGRTIDPVTSQNFLEVVPDHSIADAPAVDVLVVPGGRSSEVSKDPAYLGWIADTGAEAEVVMSVCSGAFVLGEAGLLEGLEATTFYAALERLAERFPATEVRPGTRFVDAGKVVTTAGVSAGIDGSLHLVARLHGLHVATRTARYMEYRWAPESHLASGYPLLDPSLDEAGRLLQLAEIHREDGHPDAAVSAFERAVAAGRGDGRTWYGLGRARHELGAHEAALEAYERVAEGSRYRPAALYNAACIHARAGRIDQGFASLRRAVEAGFRAASWMERDPDLEALRGDPRFQELVASLR